MNVLKFQYSVGDVFAASYEYFDEDEVPELSINYIENIKLYNNTLKKYGIIRTGFPYRVFTVTFRVAFRTTFAKIDNLFDSSTVGQPDMMKLYYDYVEAPTSFAYVRMLRQDMKWNYSAGRIADVTFPIRFVETNLEKVGLLYTPQLTGDGT